MMTTLSFLNNLLVKIILLSLPSFKIILALETTCNRSKAQ